MLGKDTLLERLVFERVDAVPRISLPDAVGATTFGVVLSGEVAAGCMEGDRREGCTPSRFQSSSSSFQSSVVGGFLIFDVKITILSLFMNFADCSSAFTGFQ